MFTVFDSKDLQNAYEMRKTFVVSVHSFHSSISSSILPFGEKVSTPQKISSNCLHEWRIGFPLTGNGEKKTRVCALLITKRVRVRVWQMDKCLRLFYRCDCITIANWKHKLHRRSFIVDDTQSKVSLFLLLFFWKISLIKIMSHFIPFFYLFSKWNVCCRWKAYSFSFGGETYGVCVRKY